MKSRETERDRGKQKETKRDIESQRETKRDKETGNMSGRQTMRDIMLSVDRNATHLPTHRQRKK